MEKGSIVSFTVSIEPALPPERTVEYTIPIMESAMPVEIWVMVDGMTVYNSTADAGETSVTVTLVALEGEHLVEVYQDRMPYSQEVVVF